MHTHARQKLPPHAVSGEGRLTRATPAVSLQATILYLGKFCTHALWVSERGIGMLI